MFEESWFRQIRINRHLCRSEPSSLQVTVCRLVKSHLVLVVLVSPVSWPGSYSPSMLSCRLQPTSTLPPGTPLVLFNRREKNCMIGIISSRLAGILSPGLRYRFTSTYSKTCLSLSSDDVVTADLSEPAQTRTGVLHFGSSDAGESLGKPAPMLMIPPSSLTSLSLAVSWSRAVKSVSSYQS